MWGFGLRVGGGGYSGFGFRVSASEVFGFRFESVGARACCFRVWDLGEREVLKREGEIDLNQHASDTSTADMPTPTRETRVLGQGLAFRL